MTDGLFIAGRGAAATDGLHYFARDSDAWKGRQLATVEELAALCWHPTLPVVYGLSGLGRGILHAWDVGAVPAGVAVPLATKDCLGEIPCDLAVDPTGRTLVAANFGSGSLSVWALDPSGTPMGDGETIRLVGGSGAEPLTQAGPHPHQVVFHGGMLYVPDLGADLVRIFRIEASAEGASAFIEMSGVPVPAGTGPRHMVIVPRRDRGAVPWIVLSGELGSNILAGYADPASPLRAVALGTRLTGPARTRHPRNYPGDIKLSRDDRVAYFANRGYDTISAFAVDGETPRLLAEVDSGTRWPQHLLVDGDRLLVAGWDSSTVTALPLLGGVPGEAHTLFACPGVGWLLADRLR